MKTSNRIRCNDGKKPATSQLQIPAEQSEKNRTMVEMQRVESFTTCLQEHLEAANTYVMSKLQDVDTQGKKLNVIFESLVSEIEHWQREGWPSNEHLSDLTVGWLELWKGIRKDLDTASNHLRTLQLVNRNAIAKEIMEFRREQGT